MAAKGILASTVMQITSNTQRVLNQQKLYCRNVVSPVVDLQKLPLALH
jgi:hypothetical protein